MEYSNHPHYSRRSSILDEEKSQSHQNLNSMKNPFATLLECAEWCEQESGSASPPRDIRTRDTHRKKKLKIKSLEQRRQELSKERLLLERQILSTQVENNTLREEIIFLNSLIEKKSSKRNSFEATFSNLPSEVPKLDEQPSSKVRKINNDSESFVFDRKASPQERIHHTLLPSMSEVASLSQEDLDWSPKCSLGPLLPALSVHPQGIDFSLISNDQSLHRNQRTISIRTHDENVLTPLKLPCLQPQIHYSPSLSISSLGTQRS